MAISELNSTELREPASKISSLLANGICQSRSFREAERIIWGNEKENKYIVFLPKIKEVSVIVKFENKYSVP